MTTDKRKDQSRLISIEAQFWELYRLMQLDDDTKPVNLDSERQVFFHSLRKNAPYNPQFEYKTREMGEFLSRLTAIQSQLEDLPPPFRDEYRLLVERCIEWIVNFSRRAEGFGEWLYSLYGTPNHEVLKYAKDHIENLPSSITAKGQDQNPQDAKQFFLSKLKELGFVEWRIRYENIPSKMRVNSINQEIIINKTAKFSQTELDRLAVHEIGTHVLRYENGKRQPYQIFRYGFFGYLECEEGLALLSEFRTGLLSEFDLVKYCLRAIACDLVANHDFYSIFSFLRKYTSSRNAFAITARVKRGLLNTSSDWGYTKDQVYLSGFLKLQRMKIDKLKTLFTGKVGFRNLSQLDQLQGLDRSVLLPSWL